MLLTHLQELPKIRTACWQYNAMSLQALSITGQCDVNEILVIAKILECWRYATLIVVPSQTKMLSVHHFAGVVDVVVLLVRWKKKRKEFNISRWVLSFTMMLLCYFFFLLKWNLLTIWNVVRKCWIFITMQTPWNFFVWYQVNFPNAGTTLY